MPKIFISHTHGDSEIADAINEAIDALFGRKVVEVVYSTKKEGEGGIAHGDNWFDWIVEQVTEADVALVLLTPASIQKPWILWEAGAVEGVAIAGQDRDPDDENRPRKVRPMLFHLKASDVPSPFHRIQAIRGDQQQDVVGFLKDLIKQFKGSLDDNALFEAGTRLDATVKRYLERISTAILRAPLLVSEAAVQEWLARLDKFEQRPSEIEQLHDWLKVAFGRGDEETDRPLDLRLHRRLGEIYSRSSSLEGRRRAARELELARRIAPRDIFVLRQLGNALIAIEEFDNAWDIIEEIEVLDPKAFERNAECAALRGKWLRRQNDPGKAVAVYATALRHNKESYYLANLAAEASLEAQDENGAKEYYEKSRAIIDDLDEQNIWTWASAANACLAVSDLENAKQYAGFIAMEKPSGDEVKSIESGLRLVQTKTNLPESDLEAVLDALKRRGSP
ncbi:TIR domain-containing protein [Candidatus Eisenbacteria bacterium]|uniref:TIR domain-containing protein n=1 Tax=Eiseniibacteriota bacterium TaxID=2212470 RepID=A0ABV6YJW5_UNCEI